MGGSHDPRVEPQACGDDEDARAVRPSLARPAPLGHPEVDASGHARPGWPRARTGDRGSQDRRRGHSRSRPGRSPSGPTDPSGCRPCARTVPSPPIATTSGASVSASRAAAATSCVSSTTCGSRPVRTRTARVTTSTMAARLAGSRRREARGLRTRSGAVGSPWAVVMGRRSYDAATRRQHGIRDRGYTARRRPPQADLRDTTTRRAPAHGNRVVLSAIIASFRVGPRSQPAPDVSRLVPSCRVHVARSHRPSRSPRRPGRKEHLCARCPWAHERSSRWPSPAPSSSRSRRPPQPPPRARGRPRHSRSSVSPESRSVTAIGTVPRVRHHSTVPVSSSTPTRRRATPASSAAASTARLGRCTATSSAAVSRVAPTPGPATSSSGAAAPMSASTSAGARRSAR